MNIENGTRERLVIPGVFDGIAGVSRRQLSFVPNIDRIKPSDATVGVLGDSAVRIAPRCEAEGPFWVTPYEVLE